MVRRFGMIVVGMTALCAVTLSAQGVQSATPSAGNRQPAAAFVGKLVETSLSVPESIIKAAMAYRGVPYVLGGISRDGVDCAGLIYRVYSDVEGIDLPRGVRALFRSEQSTWYRLHLGDLLFFDTDEDPFLQYPSHVGIYAGQGRFVHAASDGPYTGVIVSSLAESYYRDRFIGSRRVIEWRKPVLDVVLKDDPATIVDADPFASHELLTIRVINDMSGGGPVSLDLFNGDTRVQSEWVAPSAAKPAELSFVPNVGTWTVRLSRIYKGRELGKVTFTVVE